MNLPRKAKLVETVRMETPCFYCGNHEIDIYQTGAFYYMQCECGYKRRVVLCPSKLRAMALWDEKVKEVVIHE